MVRPERIELPTSWFVAMHSIQLSYGRILAELRLRIITETKSFRPWWSLNYAPYSRQMPRWLWKSAGLPKTVNL